MGESRYAKKPLLYIDQPGIELPQAEMQSSYRSAPGNEREKLSQVKENRSEQKSNPRRTTKKRNVFHEQLLVSQQLTESDSEQKASSKEPSMEIKEEAAVEAEQNSQEEDVLELQEIAGEETGEAEIQNGLVQLPFNKLGLREKIHYFLDKPLLVPALRCEIITNEQSHFGIIEAFKEEIVHIRKKRKNGPELIPFTEIVSIRLLGF